jgi:hypothetical protein
MQCNGCPKGQYRKSCSLTHKGHCADCPEGQYKDNTGNGACRAFEDCPPGSQRVGASKTSAGTCVDCPFGTFKSSHGSGSCQHCLSLGLCPAGEYRTGCGIPGTSHVAAKDACEFLSKQLIVSTRALTFLQDTLPAGKYAWIGAKEKYSMHGHFETLNGDPLTIGFTGDFYGLTEAMTNPHFDGYEGLVPFNTSNFRYINYRSESDFPHTHSRASFSARWKGKIQIDIAGNYTFKLTSGYRSWISIDSMDPLIDLHVSSDLSLPAHAVAQSAGVISFLSTGYHDFQAQIIRNNTFFQPHVYVSLGTGWCVDSKPFSSGLQRHLPALYKNGAESEELKALCDKYETCVAIDWGNNHNGHLRFSSAADLNAISVEGWGKWTGGCQNDCIPRMAGDDGKGECHVKEVQEDFLLNMIVEYKGPDTDGEWKLLQEGYPGQVSVPSWGPDEVYPQIRWWPASKTDICVGYLAGHGLFDAPCDHELPKDETVFACQDEVSSSSQTVHFVEHPRINDIVSPGICTPCGACPTGQHRVGCPGADGRSPGDFPSLSWPAAKASCS